MVEVVVTNRYDRHTRPTSRVQRSRVVCELLRDEPDGLTLVHRTRSQHWSIATMPPGDYRLVASRTQGGEQGTKLLAGRAEREFELSVGDCVRLEVVIEAPAGVQQDPGILIYPLPLHAPPSG